MRSQNHHFPCDTERRSQVSISREDGLAQIRSFVRRGGRDLRLLAFTIFCYSFGWGSYFSTFNNFAVERLNLQANQLGVVESLREMPGFLMVFVAALTMRIAEPILASMALALVALGIGAYCMVDNVTMLITCSLIWSVGIHCWMPLSPSMTLNLSEEGQQGRRLGLMNSVGAAGTICGMVMVFAIARVLHFKSIFIIAGLAVALGVVAVSRISRDIGHAEKPRFVLKRKYSLYYFLTFLEGCRKQVFITFAIFVLVRQFHAPLHVIAFLMILNNVTNLILAPRVGKLIDKVGEKPVLLTCYALLIPVFIGYATIKTPLMLYCLYFSDNLLYLGSIGLTTYLHKIAESADVMPSLTMGVSVNHAAAVIVPIIGGQLWSRLGYPVTFFGGAVVVAVSVLTVLRMRVALPVAEPQASLAE